LAPFSRITVREAYLRWAGWDPVADWDQDRFDFDMATKIEPNLPKGPLFLTDYPAPAASLARLKADDPRVAERWELYMDGMELANAFTELTDPAEQRRRFEAARAERRALGEADYPLDEAFLSALARMPPAGGVALGVDRLVMLACGAASIDEVRVAD
jgi:lysyl-tRNA synthetase class 2